MAKHGDRLGARAGRAEYLRALLRRTTVRAKDHRTGVRSEKACESVCERELPLLVKEMKERRCVDCGDAALKLSQRFDLG